MEIIKVNKLKTLIILLFFSTHSYSQEFSFSLYFIDAIGNADTVTVGYDSQASDTIDAFFQETNIASQVWNTTFEVRLSNKFKSQRSSQSLFNSKKQIVKKKCRHSASNLIYKSLQLDIKADHWPVTVRWDSTLFVDSCNQASFITSIAPGNEDIGSISNMGRISLAKRDSITFTKNYNQFSFGGMHSYLSSSQDSISVYHLAFGDSSLLSVNLNELKNRLNFEIYPNPISTYLKIKSNESIEQIEVYNLLGEKVKQYRFLALGERALNLQELENGLYFIKAKVGEVWVTEKLIKR